MLAYAASRSAAGRQSSPNTMLFIIAAHVAALAVVMSAKMDLPRRIFEQPLKVDTILAPPEAHPVKPSKPQSEPRPLWNPTIPTDIMVPIPDPEPVEVGTAPTELNPGPVGGGAGSGTPANPVQPRPVVITQGPLLLTGGADLRPPYPLVKETIGEEATLMLRLLVNEKGRVLTVDPIGRADPTFAEAARRHIILHWQFRPALNSGHATMSYTVITVDFRLDN